MGFTREMFSVCFRTQLEYLNDGGGIFIDWASGFPDPFAVVTVDGEQTHSTAVIRKTLNPYWNESFDLYGRSRRNLENLFTDDFIDKFLNHQ